VNSSRLTWLKGLLIVCIGLAAYYPVIHGGWLWDDDSEITSNTALLPGASLADVWAGKIGLDYLPLKTTAQMAFAPVFGKEPTGWHIVNIVLHICSSLLLWRVFARLGMPCAWIGGLLFCVHPVAVGSVAWISELKNTLSLPFLLLSMLAYLDFDRRGRGETYALALLLYLAAILCKASVVMYPAVLLLHAWWKNTEENPGRAILRSLPFFAVSTAFAAVTIYFQHTRAVGVGAIPAAPPLQRFDISGVALWFYLRNCLFPFGLLPIYPRWQFGVPVLAGLLGWGAMAGVMAWFWTKRATWGRHAFFGMGFFLLNLVPILGFIKMSYMRVTWVSDHFIYISLIGIVGLAAAGLGTLCHKRKWFCAVVAVLVAFLTYTSNRYAHAYASEAALWAYTLAGNPDAWPAHSRLGIALGQKGDREGFLRHSIEAARLRPDLAEMHNNLAAAMVKNGDGAGAASELRKAIEIEPRYLTYRVNLAKLLFAMENYESALEACKELSQAKPDEAVFIANTGIILGRLGRRDEAVEALQHALHTNSDLTGARSALRLILEGNAEQARLIEYQATARRFDG
jgi:Flp pilus assembly protein TadD